MSGPKVFNVVTREELVFRCEADLRRLDATIAEWKLTCERAGAVDGDASKAISERRDAFQRMLDEGRFAEVQKHVAAETSFLRTDAQRRFERATAEMARVLQNRRRAARTAHMLLESLTSAGRDIPEDLRAELQSSEVSEKAISRAFSLFAPPSVGEAISERQREIASELGRDEKRATLDDWIATLPNVEETDSQIRIDRYLAELTALGVDPSPFSTRAATITTAPPTRQRLLEDSLLVDIAQAVTEGRTKAGRLAEIKERAAELAYHSSPNARSLQARITKAIETSDTSSFPGLIAEADSFVQETTQTLAANTRRRAVLHGLASLGYDVNDGMATAWVQNGQIVLRKAANPGYGVELGGGTKSARLQVRAVAFGSAGSIRDSSRDRDMEAVWCSEFERLRTLVASSGGGIEIEQALPAGATALKLIEETNTQHIEAVRAPKTRQT